MGKISFKDIVDLAKAGYKPGDLRELLALSETADAGKQEEPQEVVPAINEPISRVRKILRKLRQLILRKIMPLLSL